MFSLRNWSNLSVIPHRVFKPHPRAVEILARVGDNFHSEEWNDTEIDSGDPKEKFPSAF